MNKVFLIGNLTRDPELKTFGTGACVARIGVAHSRKFKTANGQISEEVVFIDCDVWNKAAEFVSQYLKKGNLVAIDGRLKMDAWKDQQTGQNRSKLSVTVENIRSLTPRPQEHQEQQQQPANQPQPNDINDQPFY